MIQQYDKEVKEKTQGLTAQNATDEHNSWIPAQVMRGCNGLGIVSIFVRGQILLLQKELIAAVYLMRGQPVCICIAFIKRSAPKKPYISTFIE